MNCWRGTQMGGRACYSKPLVSVVFQCGMRQPTFCRWSATGVTCVTLCYMCDGLHFYVFVWSLNNLCAGIMGLTLISVQLSPSNPQILENTHTHTIKKTCRMPVRFWTVASSEQASLLTGNLELNPKGKEEKKTLSYFASASLPPSLPPLCLCQSQAYSLWPFSLFFPLFFSHWAVNRLHCSLSQCQSSASEPQVKH